MIMPNKTIKGSADAKVWAVLRILLGFTFLWAFFDKLWGLGFATCRDAKTGAIDILCSKAWVRGGSPTVGFLKFGTKGPFAHFYQSLAGHAWIDWLFMMGLLLIGVALIFGIAMRLATISGSLLLLMMYKAALWPANNPFVDDHIIYIVVLTGLLVVNKRQVWGLGNWWNQQPLVKRLPLLR